MKKWNWLIAAVLFVLVVASAYDGAQKDRPTLTSLLDSDERTDVHFTLVDSEGRVLLRTGRVLTVGDKFTTAQGQEYVVFRVHDDTAYARYLSTQTLHTMIEYQSYQFTQADDPPTIGILHAHSAESYEPSDGADSIPSDGGILRVGRSLADQLEDQGLKVIHDTTGHEPHDAGAYARARRTTMDLLDKGADVIFDVHRDAAPPDAYGTEIHGEEVTHVLLVVGRQNPKSNTNLSFARRLKNAVNEEHPGLVKGILQGRGNYNQDLHDRMLLLEIGAHTNEREHAERGAQLLATSVPSALGATDLAGAESASGLATLAWGLLVLVLAIGAYLYITTGSWEGMKTKLEHLRQREFRDLLPRRSRSDD